MPNEETQETQAQSSLRPEDIRKTIDESLDQREQRQKLMKDINNYIEQKSANLSEKGKEIYKNNLARVPLEDASKFKEAVDSEDDLLEALEKSHPLNAEESEESEEQEQVEQKQQKKGKEPVSNSAKIKVNEDKDPNELSEGEQLYSTLEGYVNEHNKNYNSKKSINRFSRELSVDS